MAVVGCCLIPREFDQVAPAQEIFEQRFLVGREWRTFGERSKKFDGCLPRDWQRKLLPHEPAQNIGDADAELVGAHVFDLVANSLEFFECDLAWRLGRRSRWPSPRDRP